MTSTQWLLSVSAMTAGSMIAMWMGEIITEKGIGNGITLMIVVGILSQLPQTLGTIWKAMTTVSGKPFHVFNWFQINGLNHMVTWTVIILAIVSLLILYALVKVNEGQRIINVNYAKRVHGNSQYGGVTSIIPIKLITAGVIPVIFAVAFLALPAFAGQLMVATKWRGSATSGAVTGWAALIYPVSYFLLVIIFTYFYTSIVFNSREIADSLQKQGGFIEQIRPGKQTEKYLKHVVNRLTLFGSIALGLIAVMPFVAEYILSDFGMGAMASSMSIGGTGLIIIVTGALDCIRQLNSRALMVSYDEYK